MRSLIKQLATRRLAINRILRGSVVWGICLPMAAAWGQDRAWFADGYHGGIYGHYPPSFTQFIVDSMQANPDWKMNLEIEPATWDFVRTNTPEAYAAFRQLADDQSVAGRIEFVNPAYGQSYLWNISGESIVQQLDRGARKIREHFPNASFATYSSEEPCFTSALPGILKSLGFKYAVLKNPNTCWGGYTRAFGGELVDWVGPDGTVIPTVPRYGMESLARPSTWETIANANKPEFISGAFQAGIMHPVGFCLQDAGWRYGPWLKHVGNYYEPSVSTTWRNYFENVAIKKPAADWHFSQEDVQVSLVWGAQVLQRIAQEVRRAENRVVTAEKLATLAGVYQQAGWPGGSFDEAWSALLLAQHHDCWIVPYNGKRGHTWADQVAAWTDNTIQRSDEIIQRSIRELAGESGTNGPLKVRVFNTLGVARTNLASVTLPENWSGTPLVRDGAGKEISSQVVVAEDSHRELIFSAPVPALGYGTWQLDHADQPGHHRPLAMEAKDGVTLIETDLYRLELDPARGGTIRSLVLKAQGNRQLVDSGSERRFNELRGYFFEAGKFRSTADNPARIEILESGPVRVRVRIEGQIASNAVTQIISLAQGQRRIDFRARIDWQGSPGIGADFQQSGYQRDSDRKAFYDDRFKLLALFPLNLPAQKICKNAPFDVTESRLDDTFFDTWSGIKNNILLNWVDASDADSKAGLALLTDHTTSYAHGTNFPLGLTLQYSGVGLWGRNYSLRGPTEVNYALVPHAGNWEQSALSTENVEWNEPLLTHCFKPDAVAAGPGRSLLSMDHDGWEVPTMRREGGKTYIRLFNARTETARRNLTYDGPASKVELVRLTGESLRELSLSKDAAGRSHFELTLPRLGVGTLKITP